MPIIRNPFARRLGPADQAQAADDARQAPSPSPSRLGFERVDTVGSKASSALSISSVRSHDTGEYKMSVVNDSGVYLPPSPVEEKGSWPRRYLSPRSSTDTRSTVSAVGDIEPFSISRESFDSYRRSFDVSAKSPVVHETRQSREPPIFPRPSRSQRAALFRQPPTPEEEPFEDVGLGEDEAAFVANRQPPPRKRGFFAKFTPDIAAAPALQDGSAPVPAPGMTRFFPGRKRGQSLSIMGAELRTFDRNRSADDDEKEPQLLLQAEAAGEVSVAAS